MTGGFEGSYLGDEGKLAAETRLECGICWWVYDPAVGDDVAQIAAGTPFSGLPDHWRCPVCDAEKRMFMVLGEAAKRGRAEDVVMREDDGARIARLASAYRAADARMRGLPVHNARLGVEMVGFGRVEGGLVGVVTTPWCMNLAFVPDGASARAGETVSHDFPSGPCEFIAGDLEGFGAVEICSLFSPMDEFDDPAAVRLAAQGAMAELLRAPAPAPPPAPAAPSRRSLFIAAEA